VNIPFTQLDGVADVLERVEFYWHFESKEELFLALIAERVERPMQEMIELPRARRLGAPPLDTPADEVAVAFLALIGGLARERLFDSEGVPGRILGDMTGLIYLGLLARAEREEG
jgi:AcrR family transcriptional regulator